MEFYNFKNKLQRPFVVYADFECSLIKSDEPIILQKHEPNSAAFYFVNTCKHIKNKLWSYVGKDCVSKLIIILNELAQECIDEMRENQKMVITPEEQMELKRAACCSMCFTPFENAIQRRTVRSRTIVT